MIEAVNIYYSCEGCKKFVYIDNHMYWSFKGKVRCPHCVTSLEIEVKDSEVIFLKGYTSIHKIARSS